MSRLRKPVVGKKGIRCLGVAESFRLGSLPWSVFAGVVMRKDMLIDGMSISLATVGGDDATDAIIDLYGKLGRSDIGFMMVSGSIVSWYNIIDPERLSRETGLPLIMLTYRRSEGIERSIKVRFKDSWEEKLDAYHRLGSRVKMVLHTGKSVYVRPIGLTVEDARRLLDDFTLQGRYPEPVRVAGLMAYTVLGQLEALSHRRRPVEGEGQPP